MQKPVQELESARVQVLSIKNATVQEINTLLKEIHLESYEIIAEFARGKSVGFKVRVGADEQTVIGINGETEELYVDRKASGQHDFHEHFVGHHSAKLAALDESNDLRIYVDRSSVEAFSNGGQAVITDLIFPGLESKGIAVFAENENDLLISLDIYELTLSAEQDKN